MNIYRELNKVINYIEENLDSKIEYSKLANILGVNEYTFQKLFSVICNVTIAEYIRNRRLSDAGQELCFGNKKNNRYCNKISI